MLRCFKIVQVFHFDRKLDLFGFDALVRPITLNDLDEDDMEAMSAGAMLLLPVKDKAGRTIMCNFHEYHNFKTTFNQVSGATHTLRFFYAGR